MTREEMQSELQYLESAWQKKLDYDQDDLHTIVRLLDNIVHRLWEKL